MYLESVKLHLINLKNLLQYRVIYLTLGLVLYILTTISLLYGICLLLYSLYLFKKHRKILYILLILIVLYNILLYPLFDKRNLTNLEEYNVTVVGDIEYKDYTKCMAKVGNQNVILYLDDVYEVKPGDKLIIQGELSEPINNTIPSTFDYKNYLKSKQVKYIIWADEYELKSETLHLNLISYYIEQYINQKYPQTRPYIKAFILADKDDFEEEFIHDIGALGISHLFAVSGLHVGLLVLIIQSIIKYLAPNKDPFKVIQIILIFYTIITSFAPSIVRASSLYILIQVNKKRGWNYSNLDLLSMIFITLLLYRPHYYYNIGFTLSFLVTFFIILGNYILKDKTLLRQLLLLSIMAFFIALPITVSINKSINLFTIIINVILVLYMSYIILPGAYLTFFFPFLDSLYNLLIKPFEIIINMSKGVTIFTFDYVFTSTLQVILYYILLLLVFLGVHQKRYRSKLIVSVILFFLITSNINHFDPRKSVNMIDIYGDSILIKDSFDQCNILIDTGSYDEYDSVINYIKGKNIDRIDYFIVTHEHADHQGERSDIFEEFNIINYMNSTNNRTFQCGSITVTVFPFFKEYSEENNQSVVFLLEISNKKYLFTGDMEQIKEEEFVKLYDIDVDYLKSGHHGSITSSSEQFLADITPEEVLISCYRKNTHGHPSPEIIERYENHSIEIYRTDLLGTIEIYYFFNFEYKKFHSP